MSPIDDFFDSLLRQKGILDKSPFLDANSQRRLESSYCHLHDIFKYSRSRQTQTRHEKARQHLRNIYSIAKPLFVIVGTTNTITDLASLDHDEIFPRLENWWRDNPPSQKFESRSLELFRELDNKKEREGFTRLQEKSKSRAVGKSRVTKHRRVERRTAPLEPGRQASSSHQPTEVQNGLSGPGNDEVGSGFDAHVPVPEGQDTFTPNEEPIFFLSSQLMGFLQAYHHDYPHLQPVSELLRISGPNLQLSYPLLDVTPPYIRLDLQLPSGLNINVEVSREFSYSFIQYLWMLQSSGVGEEEALQQYVSKD